MLAQAREDKGFALFFESTRSYIHGGDGSVRWFDTRADAYAFRQASVAKGAAVFIVPHPSRVKPMYANAVVSPPRDAGVKPYARLRYPGHGFGGKKKPR